MLHPRLRRIPLFFSQTPDREWYEVSSKGLLDATKYVKDFTGNIAGTLGSLGKLVLGVG